MIAGLSGCAGSRSVKPPPPPPIPGIDRVKSMTVLPIALVFKRAGSSKPEPESTAVHLQPETKSILKQEIERLVSLSRFGLRPLDTDDSTLLRKPWLARLVREYLEQPDRALLRTIASPDSAPMSTPVDIVTFVVDSTGAQYLLFVQGSGSYRTDAFGKWVGEKAPDAIFDGVVSFFDGDWKSDIDLEESAVESAFFLEARLVDVADRQILWHNSVSFEKRIQDDDVPFDPTKGEDLRAACKQLMGPLLEAEPPR